MAAILGLQCIAYYNSTDNGLAVNDFVEVGTITGVQVDGSTATADISQRGGNAYRQKVATLAEGTVSFDLIYDTADLNFFNFVDVRYRARTPFVMWFANGNKNQAATRGFLAAFTITNFSESQDLEDANRYSVTLDIQSTTPTPGYYIGATEGGNLSLVV